MDADQTPFRGRAPELARVMTAVDATVAGAGGVVLMRGPVGIGASRLLRQVMSVLPGTVTGVLVDAAPDSARQSAAYSPAPPAAPLTTWRRVARELGRARRTGPAATVAQGVAVGNDPGADAGLLRTALLAEAAQGTVVVGFDDLYDVDPASLDLLAALARDLTNNRMLVVACSTGQGSPDGPVAALAEQPFVLAVDLNPWSQAQTLDVFTDAGMDQPTSAALAALSGGNPLLATRLATAGTHGAALDRRTLSVLAERVFALDERHAVAAMAVLRRPATVSFLSRVAGASPVRLRQALDGAVTAGLLNRHGLIGTYELAHPAISEAVETWLPPEITSGLHHAIARALREDLGTVGRSSEAAKHLVYADVSPDELAAACLEAALREEESGSLRDAEELANHGLDASATDAVLRVGLLRVLARCCSAGERESSTRELLQQALTEARTVRDPMIFAGVVMDLVAASERRPVRSIQPELEEALDRVPEEAEPRAMLLAALSRTLPFVDWRRSRELALEALDLAGARGDAMARTAAQGALAMAAVGLQDAPQAAEFALEWRRAGVTKPLAAGRAVLGAALVNGDRGALEHAVAVLATDVSSPRPAGFADLARLMSAMFDGDTATVERGLARVEANPIPEIRIQGLLARLIWTYLSGRIDLARCSAGLGDIIGASWATVLASGIVALVNVSEGLPRAPRLLGGESSPAAYVAQLGQGDLPWDLEIAVLGLAGGLAGTTSLCRLAVERLSPFSGRWIVFAMSVSLAPVDWFLAFAHRGLGNLPAALAAAERARVAAVTMGAKPHAARCEQLHEEIGAELAAAAGETVAGAAPDQGGAAADGLPLTRRQADVLELAADGLTNDQIARLLFLSISTVERHFTHIYRRLGVRNRAEAARVWTLAGGPGRAAR